MTEVTRAQDWMAKYALGLLQDFAAEQQETCDLDEAKVAKMFYDRTLGFFLALHDKEWAGVLCVQTGTDILSARHFVKVETLYVAPAFRSKGVGRALMERLDLFALNSGAYELEWEAWEHDEPLMTLYAKIATRVTGAAVFRQPVASQQ